MRGGTTPEKISYWLFADRIPVVKSLIVINVLAFLLLSLSGMMGLAQYYLGFRTATAFQMPWTFLTYPLLTCCGVIQVLFSSYWLWVAGGSLERAWSSRAFGAFFFMMAAITALGLLVGSYLTGGSASAVGLWLPLAAVTVAFAMMNPEQQILFFLVIPLKLKYLAMISAAAVLVSYGSGNPVLGIFALAGCAASFQYVRSLGGLQFGSSRPRERGEVIRIRTPRARRRGLMDRYRDYREQKRLKDFLDK